MELTHEESHAGSEFRLQHVLVVHRESLNKCHSQVLAGTPEPLLGEVVVIMEAAHDNGSVFARKNFFPAGFANKGEEANQSLGAKAGSMGWPFLKTKK
jgi:hypothetical protein